MYSSFRQLCERVLRIPPEPEPPPGDESKTLVFLAAPNYYKYLLALWGLKTVGALLILAFPMVPLVIVHFTRSKGGDKGMLVLLALEGIALVLVLVSRLVALAVVRLDFEKRWYVVTDRGLRVREGIILVREATVTFANIQNISISQGPIQRALRIADLRVDTAGGGGATQGKQGLHNLHTAWFRGVDNANEIRELMQQRLRQLKDSGLGDHEEMTARFPATVTSSMVAALREVHAEAAALREAASHRAKMFS